ncbi:type II/IV secretion system protein [Pseudoalteromonas piscicida]|uniref:General secretion pathway protein E n=1 Tax=Pseudoalteromonas piscicida TaxID=43662 RepID=A0ABM6NJT5_PSEO7|nr:type II/IV secretion system protein [Pseudoalteromonas piscicida]ATD08926.1 general secretion pathway protein E [Pseudoalteromonas piscicida]WPU30910.1 type II/IV secretion system protein [Pseudoalteromonas piscicida]
MESILVNQYDVSPTDLANAKQYQKKFGGRIENILVNMGSLSEDQLPHIISLSLDLPLFDISFLDTLSSFEGSSKEIAELIELGHLPFRVTEHCISIASTDPLDVKLHDWAARQSCELKFFVAAKEDIEAISRKLFTSKNTEFEIELTEEEEKLRALASEAPVVNLLNSLISRGLRQGASDMHLEPFQSKYRVRFRVDGVLHEAEQIPQHMELPIVTRLKILSGMDIAEKRRPQDGKIEMKIANEELDIRVSSLPLNDGESMVLRFLRKESINYDIEVLGLSDDIKSSLLGDIKKTAGVVLLTGPTGSGKTTTLYTFLNTLNNDDVKIITLEDPVEYQLDGVNQVQVNKNIGFDFSAGLRSIVRQDPDIIMLGEIRDQETAQIALQSALTGHLVFSTVHTNDAASAYTRLLDLGVEEFLLNAALISVVAQRLVRKVCSNCSEPVENIDMLVEQYGLQSLADKFHIKTMNLRKGKGCELCNHTGYKGRLAVTEYLACDETIRALPKDSQFITSAKAHNAKNERRTLMEDGLYKALQGLTTIDEVVRVAG